eukprot:549759_1
MATLVEMDEMYEFVSKKLVTASTVSELTVFIEKLLTIDQLKHDLLSLLEHHYQVGNRMKNKHDQIYEYDDEDSKMEMDPPTSNFSSSTHYTATSTVTITERVVDIDCNDGHHRIRSLYLSLAPISSILCTDLCTKILSYIPHKEYLSVISVVSIFFNYLVFYDDCALIYNECAYSVSVLDDVDDEQKDHLSFIIDFNDKLISFMPTTHTKSNSYYGERNHNVYIKKVSNIEEITEIPYYGIKKWVLSITSNAKDTRTTPHSASNDSKPTQLSLKDEFFESQLAEALQWKEPHIKSDNTCSDLILKILENSVDGIICLSIICSDCVSRMCEYPAFTECIILVIEECLFSLNPCLCLTNARFPNLQYLEIHKVSLKLTADEIPNAIYDELIRDNAIYVEYDSKRATKELNEDTQSRYDLLILKILKVYRIIANNLAEWKVINDTLRSMTQNKLLSFKCVLSKSGFCPMLRLLLKCVQQKNQYDADQAIDVDALKHKLCTKQKLWIPASIEWLYLSNIECQIDVSHAVNLMAAQLNNIDPKQIVFPSSHVIPCFALSIDQHQIFTNWHNRTVPVRFVLFNGPLTPNVSEDTNNNILNIITMNMCPTNRNKQFLCIYLNKNDTKHLFAKIITFALNANITKMNQKIKIYKIWWNHHNVAKWIKQFGQMQHASQT